MGRWYFLSQIIITATLFRCFVSVSDRCELPYSNGTYGCYPFALKKKIAVFIIFIFATLLPPTDGLSLIGDGIVAYVTLRAYNSCKLESEGLNRQSRGIHY